MTDEVWQILIVDDSPDDRAEVRRLLLKGSNRRYAFTEADTGTAGLRALREGAMAQHRCLVLDYNLPDMAAPAFLAAINDSDGAPGWPVLVFTGGDNAETGRSALRAGAHDYIGKGWMTEQGLVRAVENANERWAMARELRQQRAAARASDQHSRALAQATSDVVYRMSADWSAMLPLYGCGLVASTDAPLDDWAWLRLNVPAVEHTRIRQAISAAIAQTVPFVLEHRVLRSDGSIGWTSSRAVPILDSNGIVVEWFGAAADITVRKTAEQIVGRLAAIVESSHDALLSEDLEGIVTSWNRGAEHIFGYRADEILGTSIMRLMPQTARAHEIELQRKMAAGARGGTFEAIRQAKDGRLFPASITISPLSDAEGGFIGTARVIRDITERRLVEAGLRQNAELFSTLIAQAPMGMYVVDRQFRIQQANAEAMRIFASVQPVIGRDFQEVLNALWGHEVGGQIASIFQRTLDTGERFVSPPFFERRHDLGIEQAYEWQSQRLVMADGQHGVACFFHEITDRAQATAALRASTDRLRLAVESTGLGVWEWNLRTQRLLWDAQMFQLYGIEPSANGEVEYAAWSGAVLGEDLAAAESALQEAIRGGLQCTIAFRIRRRDDGACRHMEAVLTLKKNAEGEPEVMLGTNVDVTELKQADAEIHELNRRLARRIDELQVLLEVSPVGISIAEDAECQTVWVNPVLRNLLGVPHETNASKSVAVVQHSPIRFLRNGVELATHELPMQRCMALAKPVLDEQVEMAFPDGTIRHFVKSAVPLFDDFGKVRGGIAFEVDDTERRRILEGLKHADRRKDEFLATLAHELRNPLAPIRNAVQILNLKSSPDSPLRWAIDVIARQVRGMTRLIDDLMDVSRIGQGKIHLRWERVELARIVRDAIEDIRPLIEKMDHVLTVTLPPGPVVLDADTTRLSQIFLNLLNNAAKYTDRGGRISLRAELLDAEVVVWVTDTGIGIAADKLPGIFDMFSQVEGALSRSQGGLGVGLSLVKRLVEMHGGSVHACSAGLGKGSEFQVRLPVPAQPDHAQVSAGLV